MDAPTTLKHKPILTSPDYNLFDGPNKKEETDAMALSIGYAQYNSNDISAKVWRKVKTNGRWSRQSEELPIHRVLDLTILILSVLCDKDDGSPIFGEICLRNDSAKEIIIEKCDKNTIELRIDKIEQLISDYKNFHV